jgi:hypothetical protein
MEYEFVLEVRIRTAPPNIQKEFKRNVAGSGAYVPTSTVVFNVDDTREYLRACFPTADKKEFKRNVAGSGAYAPTSTVVFNVDDTVTASEVRNHTCFNIFLVLYFSLQNKLSLY